jgi:methionyl-tRNA formyltransferase
VSVMLMDWGLDTGPVLATARTPIGADEDAGSLGGRLAELGAPLLVETLRGLEAGTIEPRPQDPSAATYAPKPAPEERVLGWSEGADAIVRRVRAFAPEPGATTTFRAEPLKVLRAEARPVADDPSGSRGRGRLGIDPLDGTPTVEVHAMLVRLLEVAPAGRKRMPGVEWARGARFRPDERIG